METCPKCGRAVGTNARICGSCGVILAKARKMSSGEASLPPRTGRDLRPLPPTLGVPPSGRRNEPRPGTHPTSFVRPTEEPHGAAGALARVGFAAVAAGLVLFAYSRWTGEPVPQKTGVIPLPLAQPVVSESEPMRPVPTPPPGTDLPANDARFLNALAARMNGSPPAVPTDEDIAEVERIVAANSSVASLPSFLMTVYLHRASHDLRLGKMPLVEQRLASMKRLNESDPQIYVVEAQMRGRQEDWNGMLVAAERYESLSGPATIGSSYTLAVALHRVGRSPQAAEVLARPVFDSCTGARDPQDAVLCASASELKRGLAERAALALATPSGPAERQRAALEVDASKEQLASDRFDIRFDGETQGGVARDVRVVLDRAFARLASIYYDQPQRKIPVVLHSASDYYTKTGAPFWSGGVYSSHDGGIQIPIRGMPSTLPREMEDVLVHELSHAFVDEMSGGFADRELQEGLAQYMEGRRIESEMDAAELRRLARNGQTDVMSFYMRSLAVAQSLVQARGQGVVNDLLKAMKSEGSQEGAFKKLLGQSWQALRADILTTFWRRYS